MTEALRELSRLANDLSENETSLKVKCLLKVSLNPAVALTRGRPITPFEERGGGGCARLSVW